MNMKGEKMAPTSEMEFLNLNNDCINTVLEALSLEDLNSMSLSCKRIYQLCDSVHRRKHLDDQWIYIDSTPQGNQILPENESFPHRLKSEIPNLIVVSHPTDEVLEFIREKCCSNLKRVYFFLSKELNGELIKDQLATVEWLKVSYKRSYIADIHDNLIQFCGNLQYLEIELSTKMNLNWLTQVYPKLSWVKLFGNSEDSEVSKLLRQFTLQNSQLETIGSHPSFIKSMLSASPKIKRLMIGDCTQSSDSKFIKHLKSYCDRGMIEWLQINAFGYEFDDSWNLKPLRVIHDLHIGEQDEKKKSTLQRMTQLQELSLIRPGKSVLNIVSMLPNLLKIIIYQSGRLDTLDTSLYEILIKFAKNSKKLKEIQLYRTKQEITFEELKEIDAIRSIIPDAEKISIGLHKPLGTGRNSFENENWDSLHHIKISFIPAKPWFLYL